MQVESEVPVAPVLGRVLEQVRIAATEQACVGSRHGSVPEALEDKSEFRRDVLVQQKRGYATASSNATARFTSDKSSR